LNEGGIKQARIGLIGLEFTIGGILRQEKKVDQVSYDILCGKLFGTTKTPLFSPLDEYY